jgi:TPP-dependent pyruvate/acetoin dehydrogenase alpha subunit
VSFFGDGATGEGVLFEAMNFAAVKKLPIIFACENNLYSTHMPVREIRPQVEIPEVAKPFGIRACSVDGNDLVKVHEVSTSIIEDCRATSAPAFVEFLTYRTRGHVGPNDNVQGTLTDIRPAAESEEWQNREPIRRFETFVLGRGVDFKELTAIRDSVAEEIEGAHRFAADSPRPLESEIGKYVFSG